MAREIITAPSNWLAERGKVNRMMQELYAAIASSAQVDANGKLVASAIPDGILAGLQWQGVWNVATNTPAIPAASTSNSRHFYRVSVGGTSSITGSSVTWMAGDWLIGNGTAWERVPNTLPLVNDLTTGGTSVALTAEQGKTLKGLVDAKPSVGSTTPAASGTASAGTSSDAARADHVHPTQTVLVGSADGRRRNLTQSILTATNTAVLFDSVDDFGTRNSASSGLTYNATNGRFTNTSGSRGSWQVSFVVTYGVGGTSSTGNRGAWINVAGDPANRFALSIIAASPSYEPVVSGSYTICLDNNSFFDIQTYQDSGVSLSIGGAAAGMAAGYSTRVSAVRLST
jgi:hypothetical protein